MATNNAINSNIPIEITKGGTQNVSLNPESVLVGTGIAPITQIAVGSTNTILTGDTIGNPSFTQIAPTSLVNGSNGQTIIGGGSNATWSSFTAGEGISIVPGPNTITIEYSGIHTVFFAYKSTTTSGGGPIDFDATLFNIGSAFSSPSFTAPVSGVYFFSANIRLSTTGTSGRLNFNINSGSIIYNPIFYGGFIYNSVFDNSSYSVTDAPKSSGEQWMSLSGELLVSLTAGDTVYVDGPGVSPDILGGTNAGVTYQSFFMGRNV